MRARTDIPDAERWVPIAATIALIFANLIDARVRFLWVDEILTTTLVSDPSLPHMLHALADQVDTSPPLYYIIGWGWAHLFGATALSLRLLSALVASAGFAIVWRLLRPYASLGVRAAMVSVMMLVPQVILIQIAEARSYGLFLALAALALAQVDRLSRVNHPRIIVQFGVALSQAALCLTHTFGILYSASALAALVLGDIVRRRIRPEVYFSWVAGFGAFLLWLPALRWQSQVGAPNFPIPRPTVADLPRALSLGAPATTAGLVVVLLVVAVLVEGRSVARANAGQPSRPDPLPLASGALMWVLAAIAIWVVSRVSRPLFLPRYLVPLGVAYAVLGTLAVQSLLDRAERRARARSLPRRHAPPAGSALWLLGGVAATALWAPVLRADRLPVSLHPAGDSLDFAYRDLPIVTISTHTYLPRVAYAAHPERYVFILDWAAAVRPDAPVGPTEYKLMDAMRRNYPGHWVEDGATFLATHPRFVVMDEAGLFWFTDRVKPSSDYTWRLLNDKEVCGAGLPQDRCALYLVERRTDGAASAGGSQ